MKLGRKGFMLAEVVVVSVVIATVLVTLFVGLNNVSKAYEIRNKYYDVDSLYAATEINDILIRGSTIDTLLNNNHVSLFSNNEVKEFMQFYKNSTNYDIETSYFVPYNKNKLNVLKDKEINQTFKDYVDYLKGNLNFNDDYSYMIIVERKNVNDINDCYYYTLKLKY